MNTPQVFDTFPPDIPYVFAMELEVAKEILAEASKVQTSLVGAALRSLARR